MSPLNRDIYQRYWTMAGNNSVIDDKLHWYKDAIIYELHIKAFRDGNGDGIGDFQGLLEKLDYLQELGVTAIWVLPFYPSPLRDDGYDIADYYSINPSYGTIKQFKLFLDEAHRRNLKVITELVINHSSDQHPWFQRARKAPKGSPERDYYVWSDDPTKYKDVRIIFQDFELSNWTWDHEAQQYYWHRFFHHQPDLNYDNPLVQDEVFKMIDYWCEMGVDGFRLDAVPYLFEREGTNGENLPETHAFLKKLRKHVDDHFPGVVFLAEANMWPEDSASYFGDGDECHMNYHFPVMPRMFMALQMEDRYPITDIFDQTPEIPETCQWAIFLRNHDELTLEMVTDEERDYMYKTYAKNPKAKINLGIRHRLAPLMGNNRKRIELLNSLLFSLPGTPVLYYGDEIGMGDNVYLGDRDGVRTPMQWSPDRNAGFSGANPQQLYLPTILDPEYHYESVNVETQRGNTSSLFWFTKRMVSLRKKYKAFGRGNLKFMNVENPKVLAFTRTYEDQTLLIVINLSKYAQPAEIDLGEYRGQVPVELFSQNRFPVIGENGMYFFTLAPHDYQWFVLDKTRTEVAEAVDLPTLELDRWDNLLDGYSRELLETNLLPAYLEKVDWFNGRGQTLFGVTITDSSKLSVEGRDSYLLLIEIAYERGLPETYQLVLTFATDVQAAKLMDNCAQSVLATVKIDGKEGVLCDGFYVTAVQQLLLNRFVESGTPAGSPDSGTGQDRITFEGSAVLSDYVRDHGDVRPKLVTSGQGYTAISYDNNFLLKMYRKIDRALNPDLEINRYLSETVGFDCVPTFAGAVSLQTSSDPIALGMIQLIPESRGTGHKFMLERINNYIERILARDLSLLNTLDRMGSLAQPVSVDELPAGLEDLLGVRAAEQARVIGQHVGEMHLALASGKNLKDFAPEDFSLHYQRSLFAGMQTLVRENYQTQQRNLNRLPNTIQEEVETIIERKEDILSVLKRIYDKKLDAAKIRIHGNLQLDNILLTGKGMAIQDFGGDATRSYSERRLKRSPLRDVVTMIRSFYYVAHEGFAQSLHLSEDEKKDPKRYADFWAYYMSSFFLRAYLDTVRGSSLVPQQPEDLEIMIETYLLERAVIDLSHELNHRPDWVEVPLRMITSLINK